VFGAFFVAQALLFFIHTFVQRPLHGDDGVIIGVAVRGTPPIRGLVRKRGIDHHITRGIRLCRDFWFYSQS
jgi:hypothetical protein